LADISPSIASLIEESYALERSGDIGEALQWALEALEKAQTSGEASAIAIALVRLARIYFRQGHYGEAQTLARDAMSHVGPRSRPHIDALITLGLCAAETDDPVAAEAFYHQAIDLSRQTGYRRALRSALHNLSATVYVPRGQFELALAADEESLRLAIDLGMPEVAWFPLATMGWVYWVTNQREHALAASEELHRFAPPGSLAEGFYYCLRADLAQDGEDFESAPSLYASARSIAEAIGDPGLNVLIRLGLSRYHRAAGNNPAAHDWANDALTIATRVGYHHLQGMALIERGRAAWEIGDDAAAKTDFKTAIEILTPLQANFDLARVYLLLAAMLHQLSRGTQDAQQRAEAKAAWTEATSRIINGGYAFLLEKERALAFPLLVAYLNSDDPNMEAISAKLLTHLEHVPPPPLHIFTLGRFEVRQGARIIPERAWRRRRAGALLRLLLVTPGHSLFRDQITEALWPDTPPSSTSAIFHQATSALRRALEPDLPEKFPSRYLEVDQGRVTLHLPPGSSVDFEAFEEHIRNEEWEAALALYQGELLPDDRYADWATALRERLAHHYIQAALAVARKRLEEHPDKTLDLCHRILALEPWQEEAVLLGMRAYVALNDRAGAIRLYQKLERSLQEELGVAPQAALQRYYRSLLSP